MLLQSANMKNLQALKDTVARLRAPDGCSWDREQTHQSLLPCLIEECAEVIEAVEQGDDEEFKEELGDLLLSVVMHAQIAAEGGRFDLESIAAGINEKLIRRHPHVFGPDAGHMDTDQILRQWDEIKKQEKLDRGKNTPSLFKDLPSALPATYHALAVFKQWQKQDLPAVAAIPVAEIESQALAATKESTAQALFNWMAVCRLRGWDPEALLRQHAAQVKRECEQAVQKPSDSV